MLMQLEGIHGRMGMKFVKRRWVRTIDESVIDGLYSLHQVEEALSSASQHLPEGHDRVLALATTHGHNRGYGAAAARIQVNGKIAFMGGRVGSYDSSKEGYMADPRNLGQVTHDGRRVPTAVPDGSRLELHGSMRRAKTQSLELVFVIDVDFEGLPDHVLEGLCAALGGDHMTMNTIHSHRL